MRYSARTAGIRIVVIHQRVTGAQPRVMFLHYWGIGSTERSSSGLRALDATKAR